MARDQHVLWTTKQKQAMVKDEDYLDPNSLYNFVGIANTTKAYQRCGRMRVKSAVPRINGGAPSSDSSSVKNALGIQLTLQNPSPTPATSRPISARSVRSGVSSTATSGKGAPSMKPHSCPTSLYLGFHKARCKSAPPRPSDYYLPQRPRTARTMEKSTNSTVRTAPQRAWQNRTSCAKDCHSLLSPDEVTNRHKERCKSAPLPYDFSSIKLVASVPNQSSESQKLKALTRPLTCIPEVIQNVLSSNSLRHCCSAYYPRPKTSPTTRQQFWPGSRPTVFQRGSVPKYFHFVKPAGIWLRDRDDQLSPPFDNDMPGIEEPSTGTNLSIQGSDEVEETLLYEEQFREPAALLEADTTDQENWPELEVDPEVNTEKVLDKVLPEDLANKVLIDGEDIEKPSSEIDEQKLYRSEEEKSDNMTTHSDEGFKITITKVECLPAQDSLTTAEKQREPRDEKPSEQEATSEGVVPEAPQRFTLESSKDEDKEHRNEEPLQQGLETEASPEPVPEGPLEPTAPLVKDNEQKQTKQPTPKQSGVQASESQVPQVRFSEVLILTSFKSTEVKEEKKEVPVKPILKPTVKKQDALPSVHEKPSLLQNDFTKKTEPTPLKPKPQPTVLAEKNIVQEEKSNKPAKLEPKVLPQPEYIRARGAYRMYDPKDLLQYQLEQQRETRPDRKSVTAASLPHFIPSAESTTLMTSIRDDQKHVKDGMKPWLQGRLALSRQTSRFELPMDMRLLEEMTPLEYLTKYCIISTRRKALYKHVFQKVDRDRDNLITFKEMDRGLKDIHVDYINTEKVKKLIEMVEGNEKSTFNLKQFSAIAAFSERLLFSESQVNEKDSVYSSKEIIEEADFCGLKSKLNGFRIKPTVRKILEVL